MTKSKKPITLSINAALFDVDGTIIDSTDAIAAFWIDFGKDKPYFDPEVVINNSHGCRTFDVISRYAPEFAQVEYVKNLESSIPDKFGSKVKDIKGSPELVKNITNIDGGDRIAIVTSGTNSMATKWFGLLNIPKPPCFITAESVKHGKPNPEPYLLGREKLGFTNKDHIVLVFEDAPAGIESGKKAGCFVIGIASTFSVSEVIKFGADIVVNDLSNVELIGYNEYEFELVFKDYHYLSEHVEMLIKN